MCDYQVDGLILITPLLGIIEAILPICCQPTPFVLIDAPATLAAPMVFHRPAPGQPPRHPVTLIELDTGAFARLAGRSIGTMGKHATRVGWKH